MSYEHPLGFSCEDVDDRIGDLEREVADLQRSLTHAHEHAERERSAAYSSGWRDAMSQSHPPEAKT